MTETQHPIFNRILASRIELFRQAFVRLSREVFVTSEGKSFHAAEFGSYREEITREFIRMFVPARLQISDGFILTRKNEISTQSDIVIFDPTKSPLIQSLNRLRFFMSDSVCAIGEVKSVLNRTQLRDCLLKLARQKQTRGHPQAAQSLYDEEAQAFTFVICERLDVKGDVNEVIADIYREGAIPSRMRHNAILSIEDGLGIYSVQGILPIAFPDRNGRANEFLWGPAPKFEDHAVTSAEAESLRHTSDEQSAAVDHIGLFCSVLFEAMKKSRSFDYKFADYLGEARLGWTLGPSLTVRESNEDLVETGIANSNFTPGESRFQRLGALLPWRLFPRSAAKDDRETSHQEQF